MIAAERALQHARNVMSLVSEVFDRWQIQKSEYVVHAGFDESLINSGVGFLEQVHVFVFTEVDATSPLLFELGRLFSPFSSTLFTKSSSYRLPIFKNDGSVWGFDDFVHSTASKFADSGFSAKTPPTVTSRAQTRSLAESTTGFTQGSGNREEEKTGKGYENGRGPSDDSEDPPGGDRGRPAKISFEIAFEIHPGPIQNEQDTFQTLTMHGSLTIKTKPLFQNPLNVSERSVQFTKLTLDNKSTTDVIAYKQTYFRVAVDPLEENAYANAIKPQRTISSNWEERSSSGRVAHAMIATENLNPQAATGGGTAGPEQYNSVINEHHIGGKVRWSYNIGNVNLQKWGFDMPEDVLSTARFKYIGDSEVPAPFPKCIDILIINKSFWSIIPPTPKGIHKLLHFFKKFRSTPTTSHSNLFQIIALKADLSNLLEPSHYRAKVIVRSGASGPPDVEQHADSVNVTPVVVDGRYILC